MQHDLAIDMSYTHPCDLSPVIRPAFARQGRRCLMRGAVSATAVPEAEEAETPATRDRCQHLRFFSCNPRRDGPLWTRRNGSTEQCSTPLKERKKSVCIHHGTIGSRQSHSMCYSITYFSIGIGIPCRAAMTRRYERRESFCTRVPQFGRMSGDRLPSPSPPLALIKLLSWERCCTVHKTEGEASKHRRRRDISTSLRLRRNTPCRTVV